MATQTEQDPVDPVKVIAVKLPFDLQERLLAFPFLHALRKRHREAEIHFITPKKNIEVLNLLPFTAFYHEYEEGDLGTVFDVHRFCAGAKIFNVDLFISLTNSFVDACLGIGFRAKTRLGFSDGWKTLVFNEKTSRPHNQHLTEDFYALYQEHVKASVDAKLKVSSRDLSPVITDWDTEPYIAINLSPLRDLEIDGSWIDYINRFERQKFILFASEDQAKLQLMLTPFLAKLNGKSRYQTFVYDSWIELAKMLAFSKGVITYNGPLATFAAYTGTRTFVLYDQEDPQRFGPFYFLCELMLMSTTDPTAVNPSAPQVVRSRTTFNMEEVAKRSFDFFNLK